MPDDKKKPGPSPATVAVPLPFEAAVKAALNTKLGPGSSPTHKNRKKKS